MRLLNLYLLRTLLFSTFSLAIGLTFIVWLTQSLKLLELIIEGGAPLKMFVSMLLLILPRFLEIVIPISIAISCIFIYNKFTMDSEIVVMRSVGLSNRALAKPGIVLAFFLAVAVFILSAWITPMSKASLETQKRSIRNELTSIVLKEGVFNDLGSGITIYINKKVSPIDFEDVFIYNASDPGQPPTVITSEKGWLDLHDADPKVIVNNGIQQSTDKETGNLSLLRFNTYAINLNTFSKESVTLPLDADARTIENLFVEINTNDELNAKTKRQYWGEIHRRITRPFFTMTMALLALACLLVGPFDRRGQSKRIVLSIALLVITQGLSLGLDNAAGRSNLALIALYAVSILPGYIGYKILGIQSRRFDIRDVIQQIFSPERLL